MPRYDVICPNEHETLDIVKRINDPFPACPTCGEQTSILWTQTAAVHGDELPVGYAAKHGVCHPDGTPRRFDSMTELKRALNEKGLVISGDTPGKPYRVNWSGRRVDGKHAER